MRGSVLIVEPVATNRIFLRATFEAANHEVSCCDSVAEAHKALASSSPDIVLLNLDSNLSAGLDFCRRASGVSGAGQAAAIRAIGKGKTAPLSVIATTPSGRPAARLAALKAGARDVFDRPLSANLLLARVRSLLRSREDAREIQSRFPMAPATGFAAPETPFHAAPRRLVVLSRREAELRPTLEAVAGSRDAIEFVAPCPDYLDESTAAASLYLIDATEPQIGSGDLLRLLADLRSRSPARHAAQLLMLPPDLPDLAAMALDLGANDIVTGMVTSAELRLRLEELLRQKAMADRLRDNVRSELEAAVIDPLTGLFNRRYAMMHLGSVARDAAENDMQMATMILDLDRFKDVNDTYGHVAGDTVLRGVSDILRREVGERGFVARIGGEELLIAARASSAGEARQFAEALRRKVAETEFNVTCLRNAVSVHGALAESVEKARVQVTVSIGLVVTAGDPALDAAGVEGLYSRADSALYTAKTGGRDRVAVCGSG